MNRLTAINLSISFLITSFLLCQGCIPVVIGAGAYHNVKKRESRQKFEAQYQQTNMERESKKLKPLDWCSEAYRFDKGIAEKDKSCKARIKAYEAGDITALSSGDQPIK